MKITTQAKKINQKIEAITADRSTVISSYQVIDESVQAELRLWAEWSIKYPIDQIGYPKNLSGDNTELWDKMRALELAISRLGSIKSDYASERIAINSRTKTGEQRRSEAKAHFEIDAGRGFITDYRASTGKKMLENLRKNIADLQAKQKELLPKLRASNSAYLAERKSAKQAQRESDAAALKTGEFWKASKDALKNYFHPPFEKNYLADVSEKWRAALFLECESISYQCFGGWGHKLGGTGRGYLCGIDDNGDEWGHPVDGLPQSHDQHGNAGLDSTVDEAMAELFSISESQLADCQRQGDLLFCRTQIPMETRELHCRYCGGEKSTHVRETETNEIGETHEYLACYQNGPEYDPIIEKAVELHPQFDPWDVRESHRIESQRLERNGRYFRSADPITITHTSHAPITLDPGEYRLYTLQVADAD